MRILSQNPTTIIELTADDFDLHEAVILTACDEVRVPMRFEHNYHLLSIWQTVRPFLKENGKVTFY